MAEAIPSLLVLIMYFFLKTMQAQTYILWPPIQMENMFDYSLALKKYQLITVPSSTT